MRIFDSVIINTHITGEKKVICQAVLLCFPPQMQHMYICSFTFIYIFMYLYLFTLQLHQSHPTQINQVFPDRSNNVSFFLNNQVCVNLEEKIFYYPEFLHFKYECFQQLKRQLLLLEPHLFQSCNLLFGAPVD